MTKIHASKRPKPKKTPPGDEYMQSDVDAARKRLQAVMESADRSVDDIDALLRDIATIVEDGENKETEI